MKTLMSLIVAATIISPVISAMAGAQSLTCQAVSALAQSCNDVTNNPSPVSQSAQQNICQPLQNWVQNNCDSSDGN